MVGKEEDTEYNQGAMNTIDDFVYNPRGLFFGMGFWDGSGRSRFTVSGSENGIPRIATWQCGSRVEDAWEALYISQQIRYQEGCFTDGEPQELENFTDVWFGEQWTYNY